MPLAAIAGKRALASAWMLMRLEKRLFCTKSLPHQHLYRQISPLFRKCGQPMTDRLIPLPGGARGCRPWGQRAATLSKQAWLPPLHKKTTRHSSGGLSFVEIVGSVQKFLSVLICFVSSDYTIIYKTQIPIRFCALL